MFFVVGEFVLVLLAYLLRPWRALSFACAGLNAVFLLAWFAVPESPRWLLVRAAWSRPCAAWVPGTYHCVCMYVQTLRCRGGAATLPISCHGSLALWSLPT
jgi:hypothetical protein